MPFGSAQPLEATGPGGTEERAVARQDMQGFSGLKACLRKPCMWQQNCRNLHVPLGTWEDNSKKIADITQYYCSRIRKMSEPAAAPDHQEKWAHGATSQDQGPDSSSQKDTKKAVSKGFTEEGGEEVQIKDEELFGGHQDHESIGG